MTGNSSSVAPFSPSLLIGILLRPLPPKSLQPICAAAMKVMVKRHPAVFRRLRSLGNLTITVDPTDLPFVFQLQPGSSAPKLSIFDRQQPLAPAAATIRGPMAALLALLEGNVDGDALFFSRALAVEGDIEIVLVLRNAIDGAHINLLSDLTSPFGWAPRAVRRALRLPIDAAVALGRDLTMLQAAVAAPVVARVERQDAVLQRMRDQLDVATLELRRMRDVRSK